ncbi:MAG TPA: lysophospholipid acyltransferase family protein [Parvularculaceae bacterium]|nr:lysophospholipid acyltransferase family protein [Parvularculaceae bacterium]
MILARLRTAVFSVYLVIVTALVAIFAMPVLLAPKASVISAVRLWAAALLFGLKAICGVDYRVEGRENIPQGPALVAVNHQSMWETIAIFRFLKKPIVALKKELLRVPVYGWWAVHAGSIPIDRAAGAKALRALTRAALARFAEGAQIVIYPEGTRVPLGQRRALKPGVAAIYLGADAPCTPVVHNSGEHWRYPGGIGGLKIPGTITLRFLPAIPSGLTRKEFMTALGVAFESARDDAPEACVVAKAAHGSAA